MRLLPSNDHLARASRLPSLLCVLFAAFTTFQLLLAATSAATPPLFFRVALDAPQETDWRVQVIVQRPGAAAKGWYVSKTTGQTAKEAELAHPGESTVWLDASEAISTKGASVRFLFETPGAQATEAIQARIDVATAPNDASILRTIAEHDPGRIIAIRLPADAATHPADILSIREDTQRRLEAVKALQLPEGPTPKKLWCMTGFRANGEFYTDPAITQMDLEIIRRLGMNGYWEQNGGQPRHLREMAHAQGLDRTTVYWRSVESLPREKELGDAIRLDWAALDHHLNSVYQQGIAGTRKQHPGGLPEVIADLMDEPDGQRFAGTEYAREFREYLAREGRQPQEFGKGSWAEVEPVVLHWRTFFTQRAELKLEEEARRRLFYWSAKFWNYSTARTYALATQKVERYAPGVGTRVNFGPPWVYDYGTLPRGIDAFEFGRLRGVTLGFNEDWIGAGSPRVPLELNTLLIDWSRAAARPATPLLGSYITRDADRNTVKLRTFACLAREAKIFDFYYYGPAYTFFDHWSDNASMVQGVAELTRDLGAVDDTLWEGRAPKAEVALLYSQSWPVWKEDDTEQCEQMMAYLALLHAGIPVDIVSDTEVADGRFAARMYECLYVVNESIPRQAAQEIERWVRGGGRLWATGWAGLRDEYHTPVESWSEMLGATKRTWKPAGDLKRLGQAIKPDDWLRPIFGREVTMELAETVGAKWLETPGHTGQAYERAHGRGQVRVVPWSAGKSYMDGARPKQGTLTKATLFPDDERRRLYTDFAQASRADAPAITSVSQILAWPLWTQGKGEMLLANYTGEPAASVRVEFVPPRPFIKARSLRQGELKLEPAGPGRFSFTLPMADVTDIVELE